MSQTTAPPSGSNRAASASGIVRSNFLAALDAKTIALSAGAVLFFGLAVTMGQRLGAAPRPSSIPEMNILRQRVFQGGKAKAADITLGSSVVAIAEQVAALIDGPLRRSHQRAESQLATHVTILRSSADDLEEHSEKYRALGSAGLLVVQLNEIESNLRRACALGVEISYEGPEPSNDPTKDRACAEFVRLIAESLSLLKFPETPEDPGLSLIWDGRFPNVIPDLRTALGQFHVVWEPGTWEKVAPRRGGSTTGFEAPSRLSVNFVDAVLSTGRTLSNSQSSGAASEVNDFGKSLYDETTARSGK